MPEEIKISNWERQLNLLACLLDSNYGCTFDYIKTNVIGYSSANDESCRRKFERDKKDLKALGVSIACESDNAYKIKKSETHLPEIDFTGEEIALLRMLSQISKMGQVPLGAHFWPAILKLSFNEHSILTDDQEPSVMFDWSKDNRLLDKIYDAYLARKSATFSYRGISDTEAKERRLDIYGVLFFIDSWYMVGKCHSSDDIRCFNANRITGNITINSTKEPDYKIPEAFNTRDYLKYPWEWGSGKEQDVTLACNADCYRIIEKQLGDRIIFTQIKGPDVHFSLRVRDASNLIRWVLANKCECRIIKPEKLSADISAKLLEIKDLYVSEAALV